MTKRTTRRRLGMSIAAGLLVAGFAGGCDKLGPQLSLMVDNTGGPRAVTVTLDSSAPHTRKHEPVTVAPSTGAGWSIPLGSTWEVMVDGRHIIGSADRPDLALPSSGQRADVMVEIRIDGDGTVMVTDAR